VWQIPIGVSWLCIVVGRIALESRLGSSAEADVKKAIVSIVDVSASTQRHQS
jgi:hypothetical protein